MDKDIIKQNFSKNAHSYDRYSKVQSYCADELSRFLDDAKFRSILEIGCGTGTYTARLCEKYPDANITAVDISRPMLDLAKSRLSGKAVVFVEADGEKILPRERFDLVTSNVSFQWFQGLSSAIFRFSDILTKGGTLCFSIYGPETFREFGEVLKSFLGKGVRLSSSEFASRDSVEKVLGKYFQGLEIRENIYVEEFPSLLDFLKDVKLSGTRGAGLGGRVRLGRWMLNDMEKMYIKRFGKIIVTHQVFFVKACKDTKT